MISFSKRSVLKPVNGLDSFRTHNTLALCLSFSLSCCFHLFQLCLCSFPACVTQRHLSYSCWDFNFTIERNNVLCTISSPSSFIKKLISNEIPFPLNTWKCHVVQLCDIWSVFCGDTKLALFKFYNPKPTLGLIVCASQWQIPQRNTSFLCLSGTRLLTRTQGLSFFILLFLNAKGRCMVGLHSFACITQVKRVVRLCTWDPWFIMIPEAFTVRIMQEGPHEQVAPCWEQITTVIQRALLHADFFRLVIYLTKKYLLEFQR